MLLLCSICQITNDPASRSWKARPKYSQSSKEAKLISVLHNVKSGMCLSDVFNFYPVVYVVPHSSRRNSNSMGVCFSDLVRSLHVCFLYNPMQPFLIVLLVSKFEKKNR